MTAKVPKGDGRNEPDWGKKGREALESMVQEEEEKREKSYEKE